jgi:uncharacterized protein YndB with AHSA1/START domain
MSATDSTTLRLQRTFDAPAEDVFDAWTNPEVLRRWWAADPGWRTPVAEVDLRVGGGYRLSMQAAGGALHTVLGEYREISRPQRLVYSWAWELDDGQAGHVSTVTVQFLERDGRTTVVLEHSELESPESRDRHGHGWGACLDLLGARVLTPVAQAS